MTKVKAFSGVSGAGVAWIAPSLASSGRGMASTANVDDVNDRSSIQLHPDPLKLSCRIRTELAKKVCPRLRDLATAPAGGITQPRTYCFGHLCNDSFHITSKNEFGGPKSRRLRCQNRDGLIEQFTAFHATGWSTVTILKCKYRVQQKFDSKVV